MRQKPTLREFDLTTHCDDGAGRIGDKTAARKTIAVNAASWADSMIDNTEDPPQTEEFEKGDDNARGMKQQQASKERSERRDHKATLLGVMVPAGVTPALLLAATRPCLRRDGNGDWHRLGIR